MARAGRVRRIGRCRLAPARTLAVLLAAVLAGALASCAAVPTGGGPQKVAGGSGQPQAYALPMPPPAPQAGWTEDDVVLGFLHASASFAANWAAARQYLANPLRQSWRPRAVTVVVPPSKSNIFVSSPRAATVQGLRTQIAKVTFTGQRLATLTASGQYLYEPGNPVYSFSLVRINGTWLIFGGVPKGVLLLTPADFQDVYQPSNLYFFAPATPSVLLGQLLVPDPVYAPIQGITRTTSASNATLATGLVKGLLRGPGSWLSGAVKSFFPARTTLIGNQVRISGQTAIVNLGGGALKAQSTEIVNMFAQLQYTLTIGAYSAPVAHSVKLEIAGRPVYGVQQRHLIAPVARTQAPEPAYFQSGPYSVSELASPTSKPVPAAGPAQIGKSPVTAVAASIGTTPRMLAIATKAGRGCAVYSGASRGSGQYRSYLLSTTGGACTSLSWDLNGNIWATGGQRVWLIRQHRTAVQVGLPAGLSAGLSAGGAAGQKSLRVLSLRMAPDGIRAAFLVHTAGGNRLLLAAVRYSGTVASFGPAVSVGTGLPNVRAISWYDPYNLAVLAGPAAGPAVYEVPLTGGAGQQRPLGAAPERAQSITTNGTELIVGNAEGQLLGAANSNVGWTPLPNGRGPAYPG